MNLVVAVVLACVAIFAVSVAATLAIVLVFDAIAIARVRRNRRAHAPLVAQARDGAGGSRAPSRPERRRQWRGSWHAWRAGGEE